MIVQGFKFCPFKQDVSTDWSVFWFYLCLVINDLVTAAMLLFLCSYVFYAYSFITNKPNVYLSLLIVTKVNKLFICWQTLLFRD